MFHLRLWLAALLLHTIAVQPAAAEKRVALVIGNSAYLNAGKLSNPANDAADAAKAFRKSGFEVILGVDLKRSAFQEKIRAFSHALAKADTALLFYAGHGLQVAGHNYLLPVDVKLSSERDIDFEAISLDFILKQMEVDRDGKSNIVFLDACRDNPLSKNLARSMGTRSAAVGKGLAEVQTGVGTFIAYSTQPGNVALDGQGRNSPFSAAFKKHVLEPGRNLTAIMIDVRKDVLAATGGQQVPWDHSALTSEFYFQPGAGRSAAPVQAPSAAADQPADTGDVQVAAAAPTQSATTFDDLDALAAGQSWAELHDRLTEISPASRNAHWNELVEQAALGELSVQTTPGGSPEERFAALERYYPKFPSLAKSEKFLSLRAQVGIEAFKGCFNEDRSGMKCRNDLERFLHAAPASADLALKSAHLIGRAFNRQAAPIFYELGVDLPGGQAICTDSDLNTDLIRALGLPPDYREAKSALAVAEKCWDSVHQTLAAEVARVGSSSYYMATTCPILIQHNALKNLLEKRCQAVINEKEKPQ
jgi:uncharacterized caspase-like protein